MSAEFAARIPAAWLLRVVAGKKSGSRRIGGLEGIAAQNILNACLGLKLAADAVLPSFYNTASDAWHSKPQISLAPYGISIDRAWAKSKTWPLIAGQWFASTVKPKLTFAIEKNGWPDLPAQAVAVKSIVEGELDPNLDPPVSDWIRDWEPPVSAADWSSNMVDAANNLLADAWSQSWTLRDTQDKMAAFMSDDNLLFGNFDGARLETIVRTNFANLSNAGSLITYSGNEYTRAYQFFAVTDDRVCPVCLPLDGKVMSEQAVMEGGFMPPIHWQCRCQIYPVFDSDAELLAKEQESDGLNSDILAHMRELEKQGLTAELGAKDAETRYAQHEKLIEHGFGGGAIIASLKGAGLV